MKYSIFLVAILTLGCDKKNYDTITLGFIGPLSLRATDLGIGPSKAIQLAVDEYNEQRSENEPHIKVLIEDDQWEKEKALPAYNRMREKGPIDVLFISNTGGTVALQDNLITDKIICVNSLNSDAGLSKLNKNTFKIAKKTEDANGLVGIRIVELGIKKAVIFHYPNDFMRRGAGAAKSILDESNVENKIITIEKGQTDFRETLLSFKENNYGAYVFFGYKSLGFAMKQARDMGIEAPFFGSTTLLDPEFFDNSEGAIVGTEFPYFTPADGNYVLAHEFLEKYTSKFGTPPISVWPPMQAYDAATLILHQLKSINSEINKDTHLSDWLRTKLLSVSYWQGICGNISIGADGASRGIYFSLYKYVGKYKTEKIKR